MIRKQPGANYDLNNSYTFKCQSGSAVDNG